MRGTNVNGVTPDSILLGEKQYVPLMGCGRETARRIAKDAGAIVKVGRRTLYHLPRIREYLENLRGEE